MTFLGLSRSKEAVSLLNRRVEPFALFTGLSMFALFFLGLFFSIWDLHFGIFISEIVLVVTSIFITIDLIRRYGVLSLCSIFILFLDLFGIGGIYASFLSDYDYTHYMGAFGEFVWTADTRIVVLQLYQVFMFSFYFCVTVLFSSRMQRTCRPGDCLNQPLVHHMCNIGKAMMLVSTPFVLYIAFAELMYVQEVGYIATFASRLQIPWFIRMFRLYFVTGFMFVCAGVDNYKQYLTYSMLFLAIQFLVSAQGARSNIVLPVLFVMYFRYKRFGKGISYKLVLGAIVTVVPLAELVVLLRSGASMDVDLINSYSIFLRESGKSMHVAAMFYQGESEFAVHSYPYIFEPLLRLPAGVIDPVIINEGQSLAVLEVRNNLSHQLSASLSLDAYLQGGNLGNNCIAELSEFGLPACMLGAALLAFCICAIERHFCSSLLLRYMMYFFFCHIVMMPRAEFFFDTYNLFKYFAIYCVVFACVSHFESRECQLSPSAHPRSVRHNVDWLHSL